MKYTICVDFDGVIHSYISEFDAACLPDPPVPGAIPWLEDMVVKFDVVIFTTRARFGATRSMIKAWLLEHGFDPGLLHRIRVDDVKPPALVYIDDRAYRFTGANFPSAQEIHNMRPWNKEASDDA